MTVGGSIRAHPERAEPRSIGTSGGRDTLAREVRLLGALLGEIILEQAGPEVFDLVESTRSRAIAARRRGGEERVTFDVLPVEAGVLEGVVRAFGLYFQLVNLAEARDRVRRGARRARATAGASEGARLRAALRRADARAALAAVHVHPVLTAHPTEARRRTVLIALRRIAHLLERADDPRIPPSGDRELRRRLREEIAVLWQTAELRRGAPSPVDEVRTAMVVFDETIYRLTPRLYRLASESIGGSRRARSRELVDPDVPSFLRFGSWIGSDRDGHPAVTSAVTEETVRIQADHVLRGHEAVATRLSQTIAPKVRGGSVPGALAHRLVADELAMPQLAALLTERYPDEPFRQRLGFIAERLRHTRVRLLGERRGATTAGYATPDELVAELVELQEALVEVGLARSAWGEVQDFVWQVRTFGFHLASLEVRQHAAIHRQALADGAPGPPGGARSPGRDEVLETFRSIGRIQGQLGPVALSRYVISFTTSRQDVLDVLDLAAQAGAGSLELDVVPLLESSDALGTAGALLEALLGDPRYRAHLATRGDHQEVMLGYSDSTKELGYVASNWLLHRAQATLAAAADRHGIELTLFHGRGGAIGRGGGQLELAVAAQPPGSVRGRLKLTEQGEVVWTRYGDPELALRHLEVLTATALDSLGQQRGDPRGAGEVMDELAADARQAYRALVFEDPGFAGFFARLTPIEEITRLQLGSRPARRASPAAPRSIDDLRAIPWVFAWSQARVELPAWFGLGTGLEAFRRAHPRGAGPRLARLYRGWPFFRSIVDHARLALARADLVLARGYASLASEPGDGERWATIEAEFERTRRELGRLPAPPRGATEDRTEAEAARRSSALRAPYVDTLSVVQLELLRTLRQREA
ncbi:MAG TPA: phosphoenolpyruvate carboxylase, partial [Patescibacteria group bacterium]|nr:phosphoenolpyruvate carboxylase [Patescibacteria group bacterium]